MNRCSAVILTSAAAIALFMQGGVGNRADARGGRASADEIRAECIDKGWQRVTFDVGGLQREVLWKGPEGAWSRGAILVLHGGGGSAAHFCAGGRMVQPQVRFSKLALRQGFAVFALESTNDVVTDSLGRVCGKRFDFSVLPRANRDLPYIEHIVDETVPAKRPGGSNQSVFMTGLSTGGYMTIRASTHLSDKITAFAPVAAGDPYGTDTICDTGRSKRTSAKGVLVDRDTGSEITQDGACATSGLRDESEWASGTGGRRPPVKQFHDYRDGIVDMTCMQRVTGQLESHGYPVREPHMIGEPGKKKDVFKHLWQYDYNRAILRFFASEGGG